MPWKASPARRGQGTEALESLPEPRREAKRRGKNERWKIDLLSKQ